MPSVLSNCQWFIAALFSHCSVKAVRCLHACARIHGQSNGCPTGAVCRPEAGSAVVWKLHVSYERVFSDHGQLVKLSNVRVRRSKLFKLSTPKVTHTVRFN